MKKLICLILALTCVFALAACGDSEPAQSVGDSNAANNAQSADTATEAASQETSAALEGDAYTFTYGSTKIAMNADAAPIIEALGEPKSYTEEESCAFEGLDKTYYFGSFYVQTYPEGDKDYIYCLWLVDDSVETEEGIYIGATQAEVEAAYGAEWYNGKNAYVVSSGDCTLTIILENGAVSSIQYNAITQ